MDLQGLVSRTRSLKTYNSVIYRSGAIVIDNAAYDFESGFIIPTNVEMEIDSVLPTVYSSAFDLFIHCSQIELIIVKYVHIVVIMPCWSSL